MAEAFRPFEKLVEITILGKSFLVPERNSLLRCFQYIKMDSVSVGDYCWNGECRNCEVQYRKDETGPDLPALACRVKGLPGMRVTKVAFEIKYNMSEALATANAEAK